MKNILAFAVIFVLAFSSLGAVAQPVIEFDGKDHKFGEVSEKGGAVSVDFDFVNSGDSPLVITAVEVNCSCTKTTFTRKPVLPGQKGKVTVVYNPRKQNGTFHKAISVYSNAIEKRSVLTIGGTVVKQAE